MQLKAQWVNPNQIAILKGNKVVAAPQVHYFKERSRFLHTNGNVKTKGVFGMINTLSNGCFRGFTGFEKSEIPCYDACYSNYSVYAMKNKWRGFDICKNGADNDFFHIYLPEENNYKLHNKLKFWRICSESSDVSLALSLGLVEPWLKSNPDRYFTGISSNYFFVPANELKKLSKYRNFLLSSTLSVWFDDEDLENRFKQIERFQDYKINTAAWVTTKQEWVKTPTGRKKQKDIVKRVLKLVPPEKVIEVPFHYKKQHEVPQLNVNPIGSCCSTIDHHCKGCKLLCALPSLLKSNKTLES